MVEEDFFSTGPTERGHWATNSLYGTLYGMFLRRSIHLFSVFFCCVFFAQQSTCSVSINLSAYSKENRNKIHNFTKPSFFLEDVTYESDVCMHPEEFFYLVDVQTNEIATSEKIYIAVSRLFKKNKFSRIELSLKDGVVGKSLHFKLYGVQTFRKLRLHGIMIGKYKYQQYYLLNSGDQFNKEKHKRSLEMIVQAFKDEGFFEGAVSDDIVLEPETNSVVTHITLDRGSRFTIGDVSVVQKKNEHISEYKKKSEVKKIIRRFRKSLSGKQYSRTMINKETGALKRAFARQGFLHVEIELHEHICKKTKKVDLSFYFDFVEKRQFVFFGNSFFYDSQLLEAVLFFGRSACLVPASVLVQEIEAAYQKKGFWAVQIQAREDKGKDFFLIKEGIRATIKNIFLIGTEQFEQKKIIARYFRFFLKKHVFDEKELRKSFDALTAFYRSQGFWDVRVLKHDFVLIDKEKQLYDLKIFIEEGERTFLRSVSIPAFPELIQKKPFSTFSKHEKPVHFDPHLMHEQRQWLQQYFKKKGHPHAQIRSELIREGKQITLQWNIDLDCPEKKFGKTIVLGSCTFPFDSVLKELCYKEGDFWDKEKIKRSSDRLHSLNLFERIHLYPDSEELQETKDLLLKLHNDDPFEIRFRAGAGLQHVSRYFPLGQGVTYKMGGTFLAKNPFNVGDCFSVDTDFSRTRRTIELEYFRPRFFGAPIKSRFKGYVNLYDQPGFVGCEKNLYQVSQQGFLLGLRDRYHWCDIGCNIGFEWMRTSIKTGMHQRADAISCAINFESALLGKKVPYFFVEPILLVDWVDEKMNPTFGSFTLLTCKGMFPVSTAWSDAYFVKFLAEQSFFFPLGVAVLALHLRFGHIFHKNFENIMPFERFYLGGANSIRSYQTDMCPPLGTFTDEHGVCNVVPQGGKSTMSCNMEIRIPVWQDISAVLFQDFGTLVGQSVKKIELSDLLAATGFGIRYNTPIGPLRFDIGWKWKTPKTASYSYAWFLSLGQAF